MFYLPISDLHSILVVANLFANINITISYYVQAEVGSGVLHVAAATFSVAVAVLHFRQCSGSARYIFK